MRHYAVLRRIGATRLPMLSSSSLDASAEAAMTIPSPRLTRKSTAKLSVLVNRLARWEMIVVRIAEHLMELEDPFGIPRYLWTENFVLDQMRSLSHFQHQLRYSTSVSFLALSVDARGHLREVQNLASASELLLYRKRVGNLSCLVHVYVKSVSLAPFSQRFGSAPS